MTATHAEVIARPAPLRLGVLLGVLGVVYGDIGTSPLYAFKASLEHFTDTGITRWEVLGILSLIFWSLVLIVTVKYVLLVMRADNRGEGGILALMALALRVAEGPRLRTTLALVGIGGACLFFGDGVITPAISVLSAVEGLEISSPGLKEFVLPISAVVIVLLFAVQSRGTGSVGRVFGPVMAVWFGVIGLLGLLKILAEPTVLLALSPSYAIGLLIHYKWLAFVALGSVVLAVTGAEALYADMGHFGARPIRFAWLSFVLPCLVLNYFGQGALVLAEPKALENPFFLMAPDWLQLPLVILATAATVIASQALISGAYSIARQCMQLGFLPRMTVRHTSSTEEGQIYVPQINSALMIGVLVLVFAFKTSDNLAAAYGIAVTGTFICTCVLAMEVFRNQFQWSRAATYGAFGFFFVIDTVFFAANLLKVPEGGYVPLVLEARARPVAGALEARQPAARLVPRASAGLANRARARHGGLHDRQPGLRAGRPAAQPQAQQGVAREGAVRHRHQRGRTGSTARGAGDGGRAGPGHPPRHHPLRLHGKPEPAARPRRAARARRRVRCDAGQLLPRQGNAGAGHDPAHAAVAPLAVPGDGAQRRLRHRVLPHPERPSGRTRRPRRDLRRHSLTQGP